MGDCCLKGFRWEGQPRGHETTLAETDCYVTGTNPDVAILVIHDLFGWKFPNIRILADHLAEEVDATVFVPDFFGGVSLPPTILDDSARHPDIDLPSFFSCAKALHSTHNFRSLGALGFCYGGWAVFRLGAKDVNLVDCISTAHPTFLEKRDIENVGVSVQILAPEFDPYFTEELKGFSRRVIPGLGLGEGVFEYREYVGMEHGFAVRGNPGKEREREELVRAKEVVVRWMGRWLRK
ncbi:putative endo-1,3-1,4-beta-D-glucanase [Aspergillus ellipticus CBS 707.79]|uniref:Putative endo-1,3-1,4-beta-D-glucanase n=1 Tax=Aspergillus ellipticus CBS 707.79 TaxID=1448320 RepID=A0A319E0T7_9EURO|nr:putative endo-1,3-1,4-beta-D-glucanase [Aspergillus ellipticus CBS 707.79]